MGYRNYIGVIPREKYDEIKGLTRKELASYVKIEDNTEDDWFSPTDLVVELYNFGKYCEFEHPENSTSDFFEDEEVHTMHNNGDEEFIKVDDKVFLSNIIEHYSEKVKTRYNSMLDPFFEENIKKSDFINTVKSDWSTDPPTYTFDFSTLTKEQESQLFSIIQHVNSMAIEWTRLRPYDLDRGDEVSTSWKYEYSIFELVRIYKSFDWENDVLVYYGY